MPCLEASNTHPESHAIKNLSLVGLNRDISLFQRQTQGKKKKKNGGGGHTMTDDDREGGGTAHDTDLGPSVMWLCPEGVWLYVVCV